MKHAKDADSSLKESVGVALAVCDELAARAVKGRERKFFAGALLLAAMLVIGTFMFISQLTPGTRADQRGCGLVSLSPPVYGCKDARR